MDNKEELREKAIEMLDNDGDLFIDCVNDLDNWNGFADGFRGYPMWELDDLYGDMKVSDFLDVITSDFDKNDEYFIETIYGIESTDDLAEHYHDNVYTDELVDELIEHYYDINIYDNDLDELIESLTEEVA